MSFVLLVTVAVPPAHGQGRARGRGAPPSPPPIARGTSPPTRLAPPIDLRNAGPQPGRGYQEPAFARGYTEGFELGRGDNKASRRYDPVGHKDYRDADQSYYRAYGSRDAYKNNYRAGFRQGYEDGYRANK